MMRRAVLLGIVLMLSFGCGGGKSAAPAVPVSETPTSVVGAVKGTVEQWRQAYEVRSLEALAKLYVRNLDLVVVQEGTPLLGWSSVEATLTDRLTRWSTIHVRLKDVSVVALAPDVVSTIATMTRELTEGTTTVTEAGALTLVLRKIDGAWLIQSEHYSYKRNQ